MYDKVPPQGPRNASVMIVGEAPGVDELLQGVPFVGMSGKELDVMLMQVDIDRTFCYLTNVWKARLHSHVDSLFEKKTTKTIIPSRKLKEAIDLLWVEIAEVEPDVVVALGNLALWALSNNEGIKKWRGSMLRVENPLNHKLYNVMPTYHPAAILRQWSWRTPALMDLQRVKRFLSNELSWEPPRYNFIIRPGFDEAMEALTLVQRQVNATPTYLSWDLETRAGHIACLGLATSSVSALCIPFMCVEDDQGYWSADQEFALIKLIRQILLHPNALNILQNGLYDFQYFANEWYCIPQIHWDTMVAHHVLWCELPKGLDFQSSIYCRYHQYWKDEGKTWNPLVKEDQLWVYNCKDAVTTYEIAVENQTQMIEKRNLTSVLKYQHEKFSMYLRIMLRGVRINEKYKSELLTKITEAVEQRNQRIHNITGRQLNVSSSKQMQEFFYRDLGIKPVKNRKTGRPTCDDAALQTIAKREPLTTPLMQIISEKRSLGVFLNTFVKMKLRNGRAHTSYNIAGTETYRLSSSKDAFDSGGNLQNIPSVEEEQTIYPNIRMMFIPDQGHIICDVDLDRADAQVVAWEANDNELKEIFRSGLDLHLENARSIFGDPTITENDPRRKLAKAGVHATNYGASPNTLARALGLTVREAENFQRRWFGAHPAIQQWHRSVENSLVQTRKVRNRFGYERYFFGRVEELLPEALAWVPQSTVANVIDFAMLELEKRKLATNLMQVHDSAVFQVLASEFLPKLSEIKNAMLVPIPYDDPLTIPIGIKVSHRSWGHCQSINWEGTHVKMGGEKKEFSIIDW